MCLDPETKAYIDKMLDQHPSEQDSQIDDAIDLDLKENHASESHPTKFVSQLSGSITSQPL